MRETKDRVVVRAFLSWAGANKRIKEIKEDLLRELEPHLKNMGGFDIRWWEMTNLVPGEEWQPEILRRIDECDLGIHLVSPEFLASDFIRAHELAPFFGPDATKPTFPIGLKPVDLDPSRVLLYGVDLRQVFLLDGRLFYSTLDRRRKAQFALEAARALHHKLARMDPWGRP